MSVSWLHPLAVRQSWACHYASVLTFRPNVYCSADRLDCIHVSHGKQQQRGGRHGH